MAKTEAVWGIDIGNCSLKAIRCVPGEEPDQIVASAFDYIEYPKILTQPGADQTELVSEALTQFLSRNSLRGDKVAISVSGQNGLARFIKLPPVEVKKIPDVVSYEVKQQIPFDLNDVIWDYQRMGGAVEEDGFALEAEVGLFAMKKDQVFQTLEPFDAAAIEVDYIQLAPLVLFNLMVYDQLTDRPAPDDYDPEDPPPSVVVLSIGTDSSDLIITDGFRTWQRSLLVGGNHFTKALTKELKLTFAKAEHLKRNAQQTEDPNPKAVFQAMRPVFQNLVDEIHRSLSYFNGLNRTAKIERILITGNTSKLPGLQRFLSQNLGMEVERLESFKRLFGPEVTDAPVFRDNLSCFSIAYGLAVQGLGESQIRTNFIPKQIIQDRLIRSKKPWAVAAASVLMLGCAISLAGWKMSLNQVADSKFGPSLQEAAAAVTKVDGYKSKASTIETEMKDAETVGGNLVKNIEGRTAWMELMYALTQALPSDQIPVDNMALRNELHIASIGSQIFTSTDDVTAWLETNSKWLHKLETTQKTDTAAKDTAAKDTVAKTADSTSSGSSSDSESSSTDGEETPPAPAGTPYLITLKGFHYHNPIRMPKELSGAEYLRRVFLDKLLSGSVQLPTGDPNTPYEEVAYKDVQIVYPALVDPRMPQDREILNPKIQAALDKRIASMGTGAMGMSGGMGGMDPMGGMGGMSGGMPGMGGMSGGMPGMGGMSGGMSGGMPGMGGMSGGMPGMGGMSGGMPGMGGGRGTTGTAMSRGDSLRQILLDENNALPEGISDDDFSEDNLMVIVSQFDFEVQFLWVPASHNERLRIKAAESAEAGTADGVDGTATDETTSETGATDDTSTTAGESNTNGTEIPSETGSTDASNTDTSGSDASGTNGEITTGNTGAATDDNAATGNTTGT
ncbi:MAG: type IV pilus assembly protein PilM [Thermoguttaceae bacterium]|nr:type IV pilus assembly protein PilM [Thermoguttaceae bacterium]